MNEWVRIRMVKFACFSLVVYCVRLSSAQDLILSAPEMPSYTLASVNQSNDAFGRPSFIMSFNRTKDGVGMAMLAGKTSEGPLKVMGIGFSNEAAGKLELSSLFSNGKTLDAELYLVVAGTFAEECTFKCLVSNVVRVGNPGGDPTTAREWNEKESAAYQKDLVGRKPPFSLPADYQPVRASTKLIPGMPIRVGRYGEWVEAEALTNEAMVTVKIPGVAKLKTMSRDGWIAIKPSVLKQGDSSPSSFQPSSRVIPGTEEFLPDGYDVITDARSEAPMINGGNAAEVFPAPVFILQNNPIDIPIPKEAELLPLDFPIPRGTKLAACWGRKWNYVTVLKDSKEDTVQIHWDDRPTQFDGLIHRSQLIIRRSDLKKLRIKATRSERRVWTDATGKFTIEAKLLSRTSTQVTLVKDDGKEITLSIDRLSHADKKWLNENP